MDTKSGDATTDHTNANELERWVANLLFLAKKNELHGGRKEIERAGRLRDEAERLSRDLSEDARKRAWEFYRASGNLRR